MWVTSESDVLHPKDTDHCAVFPMNATLIFLISGVDSLKRKEKKTFAKVQLIAEWATSFI